MLKITYKDYLRYQKLYGKVEENNKILEVREDEVEFSYDKNNEHDKVIRDILMIKEEARSLINKAIKNEKEIKEEIELYNNRFKEIYSQIIDYAILAGTNAKPEQLSKFMDIRRAALIMAETLKDMKNTRQVMLLIHIQIIQLI